MSQLQEKIKALAKEYAPAQIAVRHHLHAHPELSYQEFETAKYVKAQLAAMGIASEEKATTGLVAIIEGKNPTSRIIALRADMDALPIQEQNDIPYKSTVPGVMHACGHDVHTSVLLGAAKILLATKDSWEGTVKLFFQPGEEKNPGGASYMIRDGALQNPAPQAIVALHVHPGLDTGKLSFRKGRVMASADEIYITIKGSGGHAASPHLAPDTILIASHVIISLQQIISRNKNPITPSVLSICAVQGGNTTNVIPSEVKLMGTFRAMNEEWRYKAHELIKNMATQIVQSMGGEIDIKIDIGYPSVLNNETLTVAARTTAESFIGKENVEETELRMGAEDFAFYSHAIPGCFFRLGTANISKGITAGVHTPRFNIDEEAIEIGMGMMAMLGATNAE